MRGGQVLGMDVFFPNGQYYPNLLGVHGPMAFADVYKSLIDTGELPRQGPGVEALGIEDLSGTLAMAEIDEDQLHFWADIEKIPVYAMHGEFTRLEAYGDIFGQTGFIGRNSAGYFYDPQFFRGSNAVKFMAVKYAVDLASQYVRMVGYNGVGMNVMDTAEESAMRAMLRMTERNLFYASEALSSDQWNGVFAQIDAGANLQNSIRYDMRGAVPSKYTLERCSQIMANNSARPTHLYLPNEGLRDFRTSIFGIQRADEPHNDDTIGVRLRNYMIEELNGTPGKFLIRRTQMLTRGVAGGLPLNIPTEPGEFAPRPPDSVTGAAASNSNPPSYRPGLAPGTYHYSVTSVGQGGRSMGTSITAAVTISTQGQKSTITITCTDPSCQYFEVFRNKAGVSGTNTDNRLFMARVPRTGNVTVWDDVEYTIPGTYDMGMFQMRRKELNFRQLAPVFKRNLPNDLLGDQKGILLFGMVELRVPKHQIHLVNCGQRPYEGVASL